MTEAAMQSPVLFLIFNRPDLTRLSFEAIRRARPPRLYVAADGPREARPADDALCREARAVATAVDWPCDVIPLFRKRNHGCKTACSSAVSWFFVHEPEGVIIEDDCVPHPDFFPYCDELLERYRDVPEVMLIGGSNYQYGKQRGKASYYFSIYPHIWGWAGWRRTWAGFDTGLDGLERFIKTRMRGYVGHDGAYKAMMRKFMLVEQGIDNAWSFQLVCSLWKRRGLSIIPNVNLVGNTGNVEDSAHSWRPDISHLRPVLGLSVLEHPQDIARDKEADDFHSDMLATEYGGREEALAREIGKRRQEGDAAAAEELLSVCRAFYGDRFKRESTA